MRRLSAFLVTLLVVGVATVATAFGVVLANLDDDPRSRMGPGMMSPGSSSTPGWWDDSWMPMMGSTAAVSEPEYLAEMVSHHREAVEAAGQLARSDRSEMRAFGESIVETQSAQIEQMTSWLEEWYPEAPTTARYQPMMRDLTGLAGDRLDRTFLQDMIGHHMIAVMMSQHLLWRGTDHDEVAQLARSIRDDQHTEIIQMRRWLAQWFDVVWRGSMGRGMCAGWGMGPNMMPGSGR